MYAKDSVLLVTQEEYEKCHSSHPEFFSNSGHTIFHFDRAGLFYFISGVSGHCERGQKLIVKVLEPANAPQSAASHNSTTEKSQGSAIGAFAISSTTVVPFLMSFVGVLFA
ncbi:hypothetical protein TIFTF001_027052 [Ficus carica]|uniref:Phytocyanin domain-containing protein n=1 Tax=Ficus carica TaxID=3494 RepID=A0AA88IUH3_FICCA|nr:hypothetical protein TIFTF001_027052 [Ficus carica]